MNTKPIVNKLEKIHHLCTHAEYRSEYISKNSVETAHDQEQSTRQLNRNLWGHIK